MWTLRDYQERAVEKILWSMKLDGNDIVVLPTGAGKSIVIAEVANRLQREILITQPSKEILEQNVAKMSQFVEPGEIGVYSASMNKKTVRKYTFATIGSIYQKPELFEHIGLVLVDECHLLNQKKSGSMYNSFLKAIGSPKVVGYTATPWRIVTAYHKDETYPDMLHAEATLKLLNRMQPNFWNRLLFNINIEELTERGYLAPLEYEDASFFNQEDIPVNNARTDFQLEAFVEKLSRYERNIIERIERAQREHTSVLVFCSSVRQAEKFARVMQGAESVSAKTPPVERDFIIRGFKEGRIKTVFNVGVLTTGFDHPALDCIVLIRPTRSVGLYYQMLGRGVRTHESKTTCKVIDFSNTVASLGRIHTIRLAKEMDEGTDSKYPKWQLFSETGSWHNCPLYSYIIKMKAKNNPDGDASMAELAAQSTTTIDAPKAPTLFDDTWPPF